MVFFSGSGDFFSRQIKKECIFRGVRNDHDDRRIGFWGLPLSLKKGIASVIT
jgi:hypothetical protein